jgi:hypothetical protein
VKSARKQGIGRGEIAARVLAAIPGNYLLTSLATACLARLLWRGFDVDPANASMIATLASFVVFSIIALAAFGLRSAVRLWLWLAGASIVLSGALGLSLAWGARL